MGQRHWMSLCLVPVFPGGIPLSALASISEDTCSCLLVENVCWPSFKGLNSGLCAPTMRSSAKLFFPESDWHTNRLFSCSEKQQTDWLASFIIHKWDLINYFVRPPRWQSWHTLHLNSASGLCEQASKAASNSTVSLGLEPRKPPGTRWLLWRKVGLRSKCERSPQRRWRAVMFEVATESDPALFSQPLGCPTFLCSANRSFHDKPRLGLTVLLFPAAVHLWKHKWEHHQWSCLRANEQMHGGSTGGRKIMGMGTQRTRV